MQAKHERQGLQIHSCIRLGCCRGLYNMCVEICDRFIYHLGLALDFMLNNTAKSPEPHAKTSGGFVYAAYMVRLASLWNIYIYILLAVLSLFAALLLRRIRIDWLTCGMWFRDYIVSCVDAEPNALVDSDGWLVVFARLQSIVEMRVHLLCWTGFGFFACRVI